MFDDLWIDVHLATFSEEAEDPWGSVRDGALGVEDGRITWVGPAEKLPDTPSALANRVRSGAGGWMTPGLVDCHTHAVFGGNRAWEFEARLKGATYEAIAREGGGILSTVSATRTASSDELADAAARRLRAMAGEGVTTVEIKSGYGLTVEDELRMLRAGAEAGRRAEMDVHGTLLALHAIPPEYRERREAYVDLAVNEMIPRVREEGLARAADAFLEDIAFGSREVERYFQAAADAGLGLRLHADQLEDGGGAALAARCGAWSADHLEYMDPEAASDLAKAGTAAVLLPGAYLVLGETRRPPVARLREAGVPMAVATDLNPGSSPLPSLRLAMSLACVLFGLTPAEAVAGATREAARAMGLRDRGRLEPGLRADLALWDVAHPHELVYWVGGPAPLQSRILSGRKAAPGA